jgi:hypothetical protein
MHEDDLPAGGKHEIGRSAKAARVQAVTIAHGMHQTPDSKFRLGVRLADAPYAGA